MTDASPLPSPAERLGRPVEPSSTPHGTVSLILRFTVVALVMIPVSVLYWALCLLLLPWRSLRIQAGNLYGKIIGRTVQRMMGIVPEIHHFEKRDAARPAIYLMNHTATIDMWIGMWFCPWRGCGMAKKEIVKVPVFGQAYWLSGHLLLDRGNREKAIASGPGPAGDREARPPCGSGPRALGPLGATQALQEGLRAHGHRPASRRPPASRTTPTSTGQEGPSRSARGICSSRCSMPFPPRVVGRHRR